MPEAVADIRFVSLEEISSDVSVDVGDPITLRESEIIGDGTGFRENDAVFRGTYNLVGNGRNGAQAGEEVAGILVSLQEPTNDQALFIPRDIGDGYWFVPFIDPNERLFVEYAAREQPQE